MPQDVRIPLTETFVRGAKSTGELQVGVEWEKIGIDLSTGKAVPYSGQNGVEALLRGLVSAGWSVSLAYEGHPVALGKGGSSITLEPGGQVELSGRTSPDLSGNASELKEHLREIAAISRTLGIAWLALGVQPFSEAAVIERVPKERYRLMERALVLPQRMTHRMMKETASVQVSLDYTDPEDAVLKLRLGLALSPVLTGLFANSPLAAGKLTGRLSERAHIWSRTAPERSGSIPEAFLPDFDFDGYARYALNVPALFIIRGGRWIALDGRTFESFLREGFGSYRASAEDWQLHLTTLFTDARLKNYVEVRSADCQTPENGLALAAFLKGLFYHAPVTRDACRQLTSFPVEEICRAKEEASVSGPRARLGQRRIVDWGRLLMEMSRDGLRALAERDPRTREDAGYLAPLENLLKEETCPADLLVRRIEKDGILPALLSGCRLA